MRINSRSVCSALALCVLCCCWSFAHRLHRILKNVKYYSFVSMLLCVSLTRLVISLLAIGETGKNAICGLPPHYALSLKLIFIYIINIFRHVVSCLCISLPRCCCSVRLSFKNALKCRCRRCCRCRKTGLQSSWSMTIIVIVKFMLIQNVCMFSYVPICIDFNIEFTTYGHQMTVNIVHGENEVHEEKNVQRKKRQRQTGSSSTKNKKQPKH